MKTSTIPAILLSMALMGSAQAYSGYHIPAFDAYGDISLANADFITQTIDQRLNNLRSGSEHLVGEGDAPEGKRWDVFVTSGFAFAESNAVGWQQDSQFVSSGVLLGFDAKLTDTLTSGLLFSYTHTDADLDARGSNANIDSYATGVYAGYHQDGLYANGLFAYSRNNYESERAVTSSVCANGRTSGNQYVLNLGGGYDHPVAKGLTVGPFVGLQYVHLDVSDFTESNAGFSNLAVNDQGVDSLRSRLGLRVAYRKDVSNDWTVAPEARVGWQYEFANNDRLITGLWDGDPFGVRTSGPERNAVLAGVGLNATYRQTLTAFIDYDVQASERYTEQILKGGVKWSF